MWMNLASSIVGAGEKEKNEKKKSIIMILCRGSWVGVGRELRTSVITGYRCGETKKNLKEITGGNYDTRLPARARPITPIRKPFDDRSFRASFVEERRGTHGHRRPSATRRTTGSRDPQRDRVRSFTPHRNGRDIILLSMHIFDEAPAHIWPWAIGDKSLPGQPVIIQGLRTHL